MTDNENFDLDPMMGKEVKDKVTGFTGIVTGVIWSLFGCKQYVVKSKKLDKEGKIGDSIGLDEGRVKEIGPGIRPKSVKAKSGKRGMIDLPPGALKRM